MANQSRSRRPLLPSEAVADRLHAAPTDEVSFDKTPADFMENEGDRALLLKIAMVGLSLHVGTDVTPLGWEIENNEEESSCIVMVQYPRNTVFTARQLMMMELINEINITEVWIQPEDDSTYVCAEVYPSSVPHTVTVQELVVLRSKIDVGSGAGAASASASAAASSGGPPSRRPARKRRAGPDRK